MIVAAGTTLVDSGLIDAVADRYEALNSGIQISIVGESTKLVLELGRQGAADLLLVHAPDQEAEFVAAGFSDNSAHVLDSRFILVGPAELKSEFNGLTVAQAFSVVAEDELVFVSRGDGSGTNEKELSVWAGIEVDPSGSAWYLETGQGMGPTIQVADQRAAITLAEYGAFVSAAAALSLVNLEVAPDGLANPYTGYVVAGSTHEAPATEFLRWLVSPEGVRVIAEVNDGLFGEVIYQPVPG